MTYSVVEGVSLGQRSQSIIRPQQLKDYNYNIKRVNNNA